MEGELLVSFGYQQGIGLPNQGKWLLLTFDYQSLQTVYHVNIDKVPSDKKMSSFNIQVMVIY